MVGLVIARHSKIRDKILYIYRRDFTSASTKPLIHQVRTRSKQELRQGSYEHNYTRGYVMIQGLWCCQVSAIIDAKLGDSDADADTDTYKYEPITVLLARWENIKKDKYGKHCHD